MTIKKFHTIRDKIFNKLVKARLLEDTDENFHSVDLILGEELDVEC